MGWLEGISFNSADNQIKNKTEVSKQNKNPKSNQIQTSNVNSNNKSTSTLQNVILQLALLIEARLTRGTRIQPQSGVLPFVQAQIALTHKLFRTQLARKRQLAQVFLVFVTYPIPRRPIAIRAPVTTLVLLLPSVYQLMPVENRFVVEAQRTLLALPQPLVLVRRQMGPHSGLGQTFATHRTHLQHRPLLMLEEVVQFQGPLICKLHAAKIAHGYGFLVALDQVRFQLGQAKLFLAIFAVPHQVASMVQQFRRSFEPPVAHRAFVRKIFVLLRRQGDLIFMIALCMLDHLVLGSLLHSTDAARNLDCSLGLSLTSGCSLILFTST